MELPREEEENGDGGDGSGGGEQEGGEASGKGKGKAKAKPRRFTAVRRYWGAAWVQPWLTFAVGKNRSSVGTIGHFIAFRARPCQGDVYVCEVPLYERHERGAVLMDNVNVCAQSWTNTIRNS